MAIGFGQPVPKSKLRKLLKASATRQYNKLVKSIRAQRVTLARGHCERCAVFLGDYGHAHHRIPRSRGGKWTVENIEYLCVPCHMKAHKTNTL